MNDEVLKPLMDLVAFKTVRYNVEDYERAADYIVKLIEREIPEASVEVVEGIATYGKKRKVKNILAYVDAGADKTVALVSHYDVVDAKGPRRIKVGDSVIEFDPFKPTLIGDRLYGRGAADDKSAVVASIFATKYALNELSKNVLLVIAAEEETGGEGGIKAVADKVAELADEVIVIDGMYGVIANGASGVVHAKVKVYGTQGHAGMPFLCRNPTHALIRLLNTVLNYNIFGAYSELPVRSHFKTIADRLTITRLSAGLESYNVISRDAEAGIDFRYVTEEPEAAEDMLKRIFYGAASSLGLSMEDVSVEIIGNHPSRYIPPNHPFITRFKEIAEEVTGDKHVVGVERGGNDGFIFARRGIPTLTYGAMTEDSNIHAPLENLRLDVYEKLIKVLTEYLKR